MNGKIITGYNPQKGILETREPEVSLETVKSHFRHKQKLVDRLFGDLQDIDCWKEPEDAMDLATMIDINYVKNVIHSNHCSYEIRSSADPDASVKLNGYWLDVWLKNGYSES